MNKTTNPYDVSDLAYDVLQVYLDHGYGKNKIYETLFFSNLYQNNDSICLTLNEFKEKIDEFRGTKKISSN